MTSISSTRLTVYAALLGNPLVAVTKTIAAVWTGSSAMLSEAVHSFVDTGNELLLLHGMRRSAQPGRPGQPAQWKTSRAPSMKLRPVPGSK